MTETLTDNQHVHPSSKTPQTSYQKETPPDEGQQRIIRPDISATTATNRRRSYICATNLNHNNLPTTTINRQISHCPDDTNSPASTSSNSPSTVHTRASNYEQINAGMQTSQRRRRFITHIERSHQRRPSNSVPLEYIHIGNCTCVCRYCGATFWECEKINRSGFEGLPIYNRCCNGGRVVLRPPPEYPPYIKNLYADPHFIENIRAYNQMFSMTSLGAKIDTSINNGKGPYVFRISGQIYHWIGSMCPDEGNVPQFLQLYIYDTNNEAIQCHWDSAPTPETIGGIIFGGRTSTESDFDLIVEEHSRVPQRVNKLHPCYMSLQFPLLFVYGEEGYQKDMKMVNIPGHSSNKEKRVSMNMYYAYQIHDRLNHYSLLPRGGRLFQQYVVTAYCAVEQGRLDYIRQKQNDIRNEYLSDRADIVDRAFEQKVRDYVKFVRNMEPFGDITAVLYTIEFQKRGLPHCHSLLWVSPCSKVQQDTDVDRYISAELPNPTHDPDGYRVISELMMHGPCDANKNASCMKDGNKCDQNFPKPYCDATYIDKDGFVHYRRRHTAIDTERQQICLDNSYVVSFNRALCMRYYAHINVEYCGWTMLIKYLFKYISKGTDRVVANITTPIGATASISNSQTIQIDEIKNFVDARYIGPHEACWRILEFPIHYRDPAVLTLAVHSENMQQITFRSGDNLQTIVDNPTKKKTTLTEWLDYNKRYTDGRHLTYLNFPMEYTWNATDKYWQRRRRQNKPVIGRLTYIHPSVGDLFYQRILLCHQKGCQSFREIRTVNHTVFPTNRAACEALGLIGGDQEWVIALEESALHASSDELRKLFAQILMFCDVSDPTQLWQKFWKQMSHDIPCRLAKLLQIPQVEQNETEMKAGTLFELEAILNSNSKTLKDFGLPMHSKRLLDILHNRIVMEERNYDRELLLKEKDSLLPKLNKDQKLILDEVINAVTNNQQTLIFVYGHGGTGKTFLWKSIACVLRSQERIVLAVASSDLLRETDLIIWDEAPMNDRRCFEALDRCLRDILDGPETFFGGKRIILGGDFKQTLPVKKKASKLEILDASITASYLWTGFKVYTLHQNMRLSRPDITDLEKQRVQHFSSWLLNIGDGNIGEPDETDTENCSMVEIPEELCIPHGDAAITELINFIYDS
ncbi:DNA helicase [Tanacetum coccineum]